MIKKIPENRIPKQVNYGEKFGDIWGSYNLDLTDTTGDIKFTRTKKVQSITSNNNNKNVYPFAFAYWDSKFWACVGQNSGSGKVYEGDDDPSDTFTADTRTNAPSPDQANSDMRVFNNKLYVIGQSTIYRISDSTDVAWADITTTPNLSSSYVHHSAVFEDRLYFIDVQSSESMIRSMDTAETVTGASGSYTFNLNVNVDDQNITWINAGQNKVWFGTTSRINNHCFIYEWDGVSENVYTNKYKVDSAGTLACAILNDIPYVMDTDGRLLKFNGSTFSEIDRLPIKKTQLTRGVALNLTKWLHPNGMIAYKGRINLLISNFKATNDEQTYENIPAGVWEYTPETGLYHKYSLSYSAVGSTNYTDYGQKTIIRPGAMYYAQINDFDNPDANRNGNLLMGALFYENATDYEGGIFIDDTIETTEQYGEIITPKYESDKIQDVWNDIYASLSDVSDLKVFYRIADFERLSGTITWTSSTTFTTTTNIEPYLGYSMEIKRGTGAGLTTKVLSATYSSGTYTVTIEDEVDGATGTGVADFGLWIKVDDTATSDDTFKNINIGKTSNWIQFKICVFGTKPKISKIITVSKTNEDFK